MGALPKRKHSTMRKGKRRAAIRLSLPNPSPCPNCGEPKRSHSACLKCGFYRGKQVIKIKTKKDKQGRKEKQA
ncbi:MAG: 50S ribosomal protein L32 [bacterium]|nr:50S ribosomal protein L32 [bacterium]